MDRGRLNPPHTTKTALARTTLKATTSPTEAIADREQLATEDSTPAQEWPVDSTALAEAEAWADSMAVADSTVVADSAAVAMAVEEVTAVKNA